MIFLPWLAIRAGLVVTAILAVPSAGIAAAARGGSGVAGAALGLAVVAVFFTASKVVVALAARYAREFLLPAALGTYVVKIFLLGVLLVTVADVDEIDVLALAWAVFVGVFGWVGAELWVATQTRVPFFDPEEFEKRRTRSPERASVLPSDRSAIPNPSDRSAIPNPSDRSLRSRSDGTPGVPRGAPATEEPYSQQIITPDRSLAPLHDQPGPHSRSAGSPGGGGRPGMQRRRSSGRSEGSAGTAG